MLSVGAQVVTRAGPPLAVSSIRRDAGQAAVYNFTVEADHSYFVGNALGGLWVHNYPPEIPIEDFPAPRIVPKRGYGNGPWKNAVKDLQSRLPENKNWHAPDQATARQFAEDAGMKWDGNPEGTYGPHASGEYQLHPAEPNTLGVPEPWNGMPHVKYNAGKGNMGHI